MLKLSCSYYSVRFILLIILTEWVITVTFCVIFQFLTMIFTIVGARAIEARAASGYSSGSDQMMVLRLSNNVMWLRL
jgi:hypothetical protein